jgi:hypothetical protein
MTGFDKCDLTDLLHEKMCRRCPKLDTCHPEGDIFNENQMYICLDQRDIIEPKITLCSFCRFEIPDGDKIVRSESTGDAIFCTESCLFDAISQNGEVRVIIKEPGPDPLVECPHCKKQSRGVSGRWGSEGQFSAWSGSDKLTFSIMTCPHCGGIAPLVEEE